MSHLSKLRKKLDYDADPPRCENCFHFRRPGEFLRDSLPRASPPQCKKHHFVVKAVAICDTWIDRTGTPLAGRHTNPAAAAA